MTGAQLAILIQAVCELRCFKSIVYRMNCINEQAISCMYSLLARRPPNHLQQLKFIDCGMTATQIELLMQVLIDSASRLQSLALVNAD